MVHLASQDMIASAVTILENNPHIEKVVILDRIPRFDLVAVDPTGLKSKLSDYGNNILREELAKSNLAGKIIIASHSLPSEIQQNIYGNPATRGYDGIHLYGPTGRKVYTGSVCSVLQKLIQTSRTSHNHLLPRPTPPEHSDSQSSHPKVPVICRNPSVQANSQSTSEPNLNSPTPPSPPPDPSTIYTRSTRPDHVTIDIDEDYSYSIPTTNKFGILGNS